MTTTILTDRIARHGVEVDISDETSESGVLCQHVHISHMGLSTFASFRRSIVGDSVVVNVMDADEKSLDETRGHIMFNLRHDSQIIHVHLPVTPDELLKMLIETFGTSLTQPA